MSECAGFSDVPGKVRAALRNAAGGDVLVEEETKTDEVLDVPWNVVIHNDPINLQVYVTKVIMRIFGYNQEKAHTHMMEVHVRGRSIVWTGARERAELYVQQLQSYLLLTTIERAR